MKPGETEFYFLKSIEELKAEQSAGHLRMEKMTTDFYQALKDHMDKEDERWIHVQTALENLRIADVALRGQVKSHGSIFTKLWSIVLPLIVSAISSFAVITYAL